MAQFDASKLTNSMASSLDKVRGADGQLLDTSTKQAIMNIVVIPLAKALDANLNDEKPITNSNTLPIITPITFQYIDATSIILQYDFDIIYVEDGITPLLEKATDDKFESLTTKTLISFKEVKESTLPYINELSLKDAKDELFKVTNLKYNILDINKIELEWSKGETMNYVLDISLDPFTHQDTNIISNHFLYPVY